MTRDRGHRRGVVVAGYRLLGVAGRASTRCGGRRAVTTAGSASPRLGGAGASRLSRRALGTVLAPPVQAAASALSRLQRPDWRQPCARPGGLAGVVRRVALRVAAGRGQAGRRRRPEAVDRVLSCPSRASAGTTSLRTTGCRTSAAFVDDAAVGDVVDPHRAAPDASTTDAYLTLGAGTRAVAPPRSTRRWPWTPTRPTAACPRAEILERRLGLRARRASPTCAMGPAIDANDDSAFGAEVGTLGDRLGRGGRRAGGDGQRRRRRGVRERRPAARRRPTPGAPPPMLMDSDGIVPERHGQPRPAGRRPAGAPFGRRLDPEQVAGAPSTSAWSDEDRPAHRSVVLVEASDLSRAAAYAPVATPAQRPRAPRRAPSPTPTRCWAGCSSGSTRSGTRCSCCRRWRRRRLPALGIAALRGAGGRRRPAAVGHHPARRLRAAGRRGADGAVAAGRGAAGHDRGPQLPGRRRFGGRRADRAPGRRGRRRRRSATASLPVVGDGHRGRPAWCWPLATCSGDRASARGAGGGWPRWPSRCSGSCPATFLVGRIERRAEPTPCCYIAALVAIAAGARRPSAAGSSGGWPAPGADRGGGAAHRGAGRGRRGAGRPAAGEHVFGYSVAVAGRFAGLGNLAFALFGSATIVLAALIVDRTGAPRARAWRSGCWRPWCSRGPAHAGRRRRRGRWPWCPPSGSPPCCWRAGGSAGGRWWRWPWRLAWRCWRFAFVDAARPEDVQTHLARLADHVIDGRWATFFKSLSRRWQASLGGAELAGLADRRRPCRWPRSSTPRWRPRAGRAPRSRSASGTARRWRPLPGWPCSATIGLVANDSSVAVPLTMFIVIVPVVASSGAVARTGRVTR